MHNWSKPSIIIWSCSRSASRYSRTTSSCWASWSSTASSREVICTQKVTTDTSPSWLFQAITTPLLSRPALSLTRSLSSAKTTNSTPIWYRALSISQLVWLQSREILKSNLFRSLKLSPRRSSTSNRRITRSLWVWVRVFCIPRPIWSRGRVKFHRWPHRISLSEAAGLMTGTLTRTSTILIE